MSIVNIANENEIRTLSLDEIKSVSGAATLDKGNGGTMICYNWANALWCDVIYTK